MSWLLLVHTLLCAWFALDFIGVPRLVSKDPLRGLAGALLAAIVAIELAYLLGQQRAAFAAVPVLGYWCWNQRRHWIFHFAGAPPEIVIKYASLFGDMVSILPRQPGRVVPDAYHTILHALLVADLALSLAACARLLG